MVIAGPGGEEMTTIHRATRADLSYIKHLGNKESEAIGFIPLQRYEIEMDTQGTILVAKENDDYVGFLYATHNRAGVTRIQQIAIQEDARLLERGKALVDAATKATDWLVSCRCADELPSTTFWESLGFQHQGIVPTAKSVYGRGQGDPTLPTRRHRTINRYQKVVGGLWATDILQ